MAYVVPRDRGRWELRESRATPRGPRSSTLASFRELTEDDLDKATRRAAGVLTPEQILRAARRAGAPVALDRPDRLAASLLAELHSGGELSSGMRRALGERLRAGAEPPLSHAQRAAAEWLGAPLEQRGEALRDLLLLTDRLPGAGPRARPSKRAPGR